jgi:hypothetical protein
MTLSKSNLIAISQSNLEYSNLNILENAYITNLFVTSNLEINNGILTLGSNVFSSNYINIETELNVNNNITLNNTVTLSNSLNNTSWKMCNYYVDSNISDLVFVSNHGNATTFTDTFTEGLLNFTGQHTVSTVIEDFKEDLIGKIVISTGVYKDLDGSDVIRVDECTPVVELSTLEKDSRVFGVISGFEELNKDTRQFKIGNLVFNKNKEKDDIKLVVNGAGEGGLLVCNYNGPIHNGDLLCTSPIEGLAMKQDDDIIHSYTVAKVTCSCDFKKIYPKSKHGLKTIQYKKKKYKYCLVGCSYKF